MRPLAMVMPILIAVILAVIVMGVGGVLTDVGPWYRDLKKPSWNPPNWLFGPAWAVIIGLAAWAGVSAWLHAVTPAQHTLILALYGANIVLHMAWSPLFFNLRRPDWALMEVPFLWLSILALIVGLTPISRLSGLLLTPYILWVSFATVLNLVIVRLNAPFGRALAARSV
jgi:tryptophan-rich sensory protein